MSKEAVKSLLRPIARLLVKGRIVPKRIIIEMDGGICSQMHFYLLGRLIEQSGGEKVYFDLEWFDKDGTDDENRFARNFDLLKIFPSLEFRRQKKGFVRKIYNSLFYRFLDYREFRCTPDSVKTFKAPLYIDGYFNETEEFFKDFPTVFKIDPSLLPEDNKSLYERIKAAESGKGACAVHIRRGDLAKPHPVYGNPLTPADIVEKFNEMRRRNGEGIRYFVFSDEPDWFRDNVATELKDFDVTIADVNGSDRGWCDLILMTQCRHHIKSQGSMGKYAEYLSRR